MNRLHTSFAILAILVAPLLLGTCGDPARVTALDPAAPPEVPVAPDDFNAANTTRYTDFGSYPTGQRPSDWSEPYTTSAYTVQARSGTTGGKVLHNSPGTTNPHVLRWDTQGTLLDVELETVARVVAGSSANDGMGLVARGTNGARTFYATRLDNGRWTVSRYVNGSAEILGRFNTSWPTGTWVRQKFRVTGDSVKAKFWPDGTPEPASWSVQARDTGTPLAAGFVGVFLRRAGVANEYDRVQVTPLNQAPGNQRPVAAAGGPYAAAEGAAITFDGTASSDPDGDPLTLSWDFGDGNTGTGASPTHSYADNGGFTVRLIVTDAQGASDTTTTTASISNVAPNVSVSLSPTSVRVGETVTLVGSFADPGTADGPWRHETDWGDGVRDTASVTSPGTPISRSRSYTAAGTYSVRFSVTDKDGGTGSATQSLTVTAATSPPPTSYYTDFSSYTTGQRPSDWSYPYTNSSYTVQARTDATGGKVLYNSISATGYHVLRWDAVGTLADVELETVARVVTGSTYNESLALVARGTAGTQTFYSSRLDSGSGLWTLARYNSGTSSALATWSNPFPVGTWVRHRFRVEGTSLKVKLWRADSPEPASWTLQATDGSPLGSGFAGVWMRRGAAINEFDWVRITPITGSTPNQPPSANFTHRSSGQTVHFTDTSTDPDGAVVAWSWTFGDGGTSTQRHPSYRFAAAGTYTVRLTATDNSGAQNSKQQAVTVAASPPYPVLVGAGDIAGCGVDAYGIEYQDEATANLLDGYPQATVFTAGDNVYPNGTAEEFANCYGPSWGRHKARTRPSAGNHEYNTPNATPYYDYFGAAAGEPGKGYYSFRQGSWFIVVLNTNIDMSVGSAQEQWLRAELAANPTRCSLAIWHHARFSSNRSDARVQPLWEALFEAGADVAVVSHDHFYERLAPMRADGTLDRTRGMRQFIVGTGGARLYAFNGTHPNSEARNNDSHGVLKLTLEEDAYSWEFIPVPGKSFTDTGRESCR